MDNTRRALMVGAMAALLALPLGAQVQPSYRVNLRLDAREWTLLAREDDHRVAIVEYVPFGESAERWTRFVAIHLFSEAAVPFPGAGEAVAESRRLLMGRCPGATWTTLRESPGDALYEWRVTGCALEPDQHELGRLLSRPGVWARVTFTATGAMSAGVRQAWLNRLSRAALVEAGR